MSRPRRRDERYRRSKPPSTPPERRVAREECVPCGGKIAWATRKAAKRATRTTPDGGGALHAYRCPHDDRTWHVGHMGSDKSRAYYREKAER